MIPGLRRAAVFALTFIPALASAQITTVISAPKRQQATAQAAAQREAAAQDSIARVTLTGMKEWVDSAANALAVKPDTAVTIADTALAPTPTPAAQQRPDSTANRTKTPRTADTFRDGARAPNTATPWPTLAALGFGLIAAGALLRRRLTPARPRSGRG